MTCLAPPVDAQEARRRWEMQRQIRLDKFEQVLPQAMRAHGIDMWIVAVKENHTDPLWDDLGPRLRLRASATTSSPIAAASGSSARRSARAATSRRVGRLRHLRARVDAGGVRQGAQPQPHRRQHVRRDRAGRRAVRTRCSQHLVKTLGEPYAVAARQRRAAGQRVPLAPRRRRRSSRSAKPRASRSSSPSARSRTR